MGLEYRFNIPRTYCEKWPDGCLFCDLLLCDGKKETAIANISERDYKTCVYKCGKSKCVAEHTAHGYCNLYSAEAKPTDADRKPAEGGRKMNIADDLAKAFSDGYEQGKADAVPVVLCKDCRWHTDEEPGMVYCPNIVGGWVQDDWFCKGGEGR